MPAGTPAIGEFITNHVEVCENDAFDIILFERLSHTRDAVGHAGQDRPSSPQQSPVSSWTTILTHCREDQQRNGPARGDRANRELAGRTSPTALTIYYYAFCRLECSVYSGPLKLCAREKSLCFSHLVLRRLPCDTVRRAARRPKYDRSALNPNCAYKKSSAISASSASSGSQSIRHEPRRRWRLYGTARRCRLWRRDSGHEDPGAVRPCPRAEQRPARPPFPVNPTC